MAGGRSNQTGGEHAVDMGLDRLVLPVSARGHLCRNQEKSRKSVSLLARREDIHLVVLGSGRRRRIGLDASVFQYGPDFGELSDESGAVRPRKTKGPPSSADLRRDVRKPDPDPFSFRDMSGEVWLPESADGCQTAVAFKHNETPTLNGGTLLLPEVDRKWGLTERVARAPGDGRPRAKVRHEVMTMLRQRRRRWDPRTSTTTMVFATMKWSKPCRRHVRARKGVWFRVDCRVRRLLWASGAPEPALAFRRPGKSGYTRGEKRKWRDLR